MSQDENIPVILLKTRSAAGDGYEDVFSEPAEGLNFQPVFVPVLEHRFEESGMNQFRRLLQAERITKANEEGNYGGLIFTSQRAVEAFANIVQEGKGDKGWPHLQGVPIYSVGPATTRALKAVPQDTPLEVFGEHTGNGDKLAQFILEHYGEWYKDRQSKPPLLFLVGEQRRDIIPKVLMDERLSDSQRIQVDEIVLYGTGVMESFAADFSGVLETSAAQPMRWVVVFSPTGCDSMLRCLDMLDPQSGKARTKDPRRTAYIATIGPTTKAYLNRTFDFDPDVCSRAPNPKGVWMGITEYIAAQR